jgi:hypothetical protein
MIAESGICLASDETPTQRRLRAVSSQLLTGVVVGLVVMVLTKGI